MSDNKHPLESVAEALDNAAQIISNLYNADLEDRNDWKFHLVLTLSALTTLREYIANDLAEGG